MVDIDLDAGRERRAAEREGDGRQPTLKVNGKVYKLPVEMPLDLLRTEDPTAMDSIAHILFGDDAAEVWPKLTVPDFVEIIKGLRVAYGITPGESQASATS